MGDYLIYVIVIILVVLKILFWTFYFYARSQRYRAATTQHRFLVVDTRHTVVPSRRRNTDRMIIIQNEHLPENESVNPTDYHANVAMPPSYDEVVSGPNQSTNQECKPPSYDQVVQGQTTYNPQQNPQQLMQSSSPNPLYAQSQGH